jgi:hypothetical protein
MRGGNVHRPSKIYRQKDRDMFSQPMPSAAEFAGGLRMVAVPTAILIAPICCRRSKMFPAACRSKARRLNQQN